jgi:hypothetical protein
VAQVVCPVNFPAETGNFENNSKSNAGFWAKTRVSEGLYWVLRGVFCDLRRKKTVQNGPRSQEDNMRYYAENADSQGKQGMLIFGLDTGLFLA